VRPAIVRKIRDFCGWGTWTDADAGAPELKAARSVRPLQLKAEEPQMDTIVKCHQETPAAARPDNAQLLFKPNISINGLIEDATVAFFLGRLEKVRAGDQPMIMEINTDGGAADAARRIALEVRLFTKFSGLGAYCVGKSNVYSAGVTLFAAFPKRARFLTEDAILLVHERRLDSTIDLKGPLKSCLQIVREQLALLETAERLEVENFKALVKGSSMSFDEIRERATTNCYIHAEEALKLGLVEEILR
jgi:ATP-dependent protease ClpP protease subunit